MRARRGSSTSLALKPAGRMWWLLHVSKASTYHLTCLHSSEAEDTVATPTPLAEMFLHLLVQKNATDLSCCPFHWGQSGGRGPGNPKDSQAQVNTTYKPFPLLTSDFHDSSCSVWRGSLLTQDLQRFSERAKKTEEYNPSSKNLQTPSSI